MEQCKMCDKNNKGVLIPTEHIINGICEPHYDAIMEFINDKE